MTKQNRVPIQDKYKLLRTIENNGKRDGDRWVYNDGWTDERIASMFSVNAHVVKHNRQRIFGHIARGPGTSADLKARIEALEARVAALENPQDVKQPGNGKTIEFWR